MDPLSYINWIKRILPKVSWKLCKLGHFLRSLSSLVKTDLLHISSLEVYKQSSFIVSTVLCKRNETEIREFRLTNCELSFQTKSQRNLSASIFLVPRKFRKLGDEPKRKFARWTEISLLNLASLTKFRFVLNGISVNEPKFRVSETKFRYWKVLTDQGPVSRKSR